VRSTRIRSLHLRILDRGVRISGADDHLLSLASAAYGAMRDDPGPAELHYSLSRTSAPTTFVIERPRLQQLIARDEGALLALLDRDLGIEIQKLRYDLYFVHAAVVQYKRVAVMLVARSGGGKSTVCWALLHHRFRYLSDEFAPIDLERLEVHPLPRALSVKRAPPKAYPLPRSTLRTSRSLRVPVDGMPTDICTTPSPLSVVFFLCYRPGTVGPSARLITHGEAATRLYANSLNPLAHGDGLDAVLRIARHCQCFELVTVDLASTAALVSATLERLV
jgi:hypothetical protein